MSGAAEKDTFYWIDKTQTKGATVTLSERHAHGSRGVPLLPCGCVAGRDTPPAEPPS